MPTLVRLCFVRVLAAVDGGVDLVMTLFSRHTSSAIAVEACAMFLETVVTQGADVELLSRLNVVPLVVASMLRFPEALQLQVMR